jgi:hypothetical protein
VGTASFATLITRLADLHRLAQVGKLGAKDAATYEALRSEFTALMLFAQHLAMDPSRTHRRALRVALAVELKLMPMAVHHRTTTITLSAGGFSARVPGLLAPGEIVPFVLSVTPEPIRGRARAVASRSQHGMVVVSFAFEEITEVDRARLGEVVFDSALSAVSNRLSQAAEPKTNPGTGK